MRDYKIEWDVRLWTYVLIYNGETYPLNVNNAPGAYERAQLRLAQIKREEHKQE